MIAGSGPTAQLETARQPADPGADDTDAAAGTAGTADAGTEQYGDDCGPRFPRTLQTAAAGDPQRRAFSEHRQSRPQRQRRPPDVAFDQLQESVDSARSRVRPFGQSETPVSAG